MDYVRKIANSDIFDNIFDLPENLRHKKVEIIILPYPETGDAAGVTYVSEYKSRSRRYRNRRYRNPKSNHPEEPTWLESAYEYYENR